MLDLRENAKIYRKKPHVQRSKAMIWHLFANDSQGSARRRPRLQISIRKECSAKWISRGNEGKFTKFVGVPVGWEAGVEEDGGGEGEQSGWCSVSLYRALVRACALLLGQITFIPIQASRAKVSLFSAQKPGMWMGLAHSAL